MPKPINRVATSRTAESPVTAREDAPGTALPSSDAALNLVRQRLLCGNSTDYEMDSFIVDQRVMMTSA